MRVRKDRKRELIKAVPLFAHCSNKELDRLTSELDEIEMPSGKVLARQGEPGREFVVLVDGTRRGDEGRPADQPARLRRLPG